MLALVSLLVALALPQNGVLAPGRSLGGVHLGDTRAAVIARWGVNFGVWVALFQLSGALQYQEVREGAI